MHPLKDYLKTLTDAQAAAFAEHCGTSVGHLKNIAGRHKTCAEKLAINIERESDGAVLCEDLRPDVDWAFMRSGGAAHKQEAA